MGRKREGGGKDSERARRVSSCSLRVPSRNEPANQSSPSFPSPRSIPLPRLRNSRSFVHLSPPLPFLPPSPPPLTSLPYPLPSPSSSSPSNSSNHPHPRLPLHRQPPSRQRRSQRLHSQLTFHPPNLPPSRRIELEKDDLRCCDWSDAGRVDQLGGRGEGGKRDQEGGGVGLV